jgi:hypothetical protein
VVLLWVPYAASSSRCGGPFDEFRARIESVLKGKRTQARNFNDTFSLSYGNTSIFLQLLAFRRIRAANFSVKGS